MQDVYRAFVFRPSASASGDGVLAGMTLAIKDNIDVQGMPTQAASPAVPGYPATEDAPVVAALRTAGASIVGKANMHELAFGVTSENPWSGAVVNPAFPRRIAGGSSGGTAAAIASGLADAGLASDTGGSARIPAWLCGIVGFRPSTGRYSNRGVLLLSNTFDSVGLMGRSVADVELVDAVLTRQPRVGAATLAGVRLAAPHAYYRESLATAVAAAFEESLARLRGAGCTLIDADIDELGSEVAEWHLTIVLHEADRFWRAQVRRFGQSLSEFASEIATPRVREAFELLAAGGAPSQAAYQVALDRKLPSARQAIVDYLNATGAVALVVPASPIAGPAAGPRARSEDDALFDLLTRNMLPATIAAQPSICIPIGANEPVGLLLDGRPGKDRQLLALALAAEPVLRIR